MTDNKLPKELALPHEISDMPANTPILVAFSGGADSSVLLHLMARYGKIYGATIYAAHVNHMIRGEEADRDEQHCKKVAEALGVKLFVKRCDVPSIAKERGESVETAARNIRYEFFDSLMSEYSIPLLATAHNACDNLETMLFNMIRGAGLGGMCGIPPVRACKGGTVIRPILSMNRKQILDICRTLDISYVTDSTNTDIDYTRNKIRSLIIPALEEINPQAVKNSSRLAASLRHDSMCLESMTDMFLESFDDDLSIETEKLLGSPPSIANRAIMAVYKDITNGNTLESVHIDAIRELCHKGTPHSSVELPAGIDARIENGRLYLIKHRPAPAPSESFEIEIRDTETFISEINAQIIMGNSQKPINIYKNSILLYLDSDKIIGSLTARERRAGDKIRIHGVNKSIKKLLCDNKIPLEVRYRLPIICDDDEIVAVPGIGVCDRVWTKDRKNSLRLVFQLF